LEPGVARPEEEIVTAPERAEAGAAETPVFTRPVKTGVLKKLWKGIKGIFTRK
jgi:hypothetical protein